MLTKLNELGEVSTCETILVEGYLQKSDGKIKIIRIFYLFLIMVQFSFKNNNDCTIIGDVLVDLTLWRS